MVRNARHETSLIVRVIGRHEAHAEEVGGQIRVTIPGAVITLADAEAAVGVYRAWCEAEVFAGIVYKPGAAQRLYVRPAQRIVAAVLLEGEQPGPTLTGRGPEASPSGWGQMVVRIGRLTIICDDAPAWRSQHAAWSQAYGLAGQLWKVPDAKRVADAAERRGIARLSVETSD